MKRSTFHYVLPPDLVARYPLTDRSSSRLMVLDATTGAVQHHQFHALLEFLVPGDLLVFNDTRVLPARLWGRKQSGGGVELLIERLTGTHTALTHIRASKSPKIGSEIRLCRESRGEPGMHQLTVTGREQDLYEISSLGGVPLAVILNEIGHMPLPPYIAREDEPIDRERYQTVYARSEGAIAAPTAGLHFTPELLAQLHARGIGRAMLTLHVGAGTFQPVREEDIERHLMHREYVVVDEAVCRAVRQTHARGSRVVAVGTTSVRALETAARATGVIQPFRGETDIFIYPGYRFRCVDAIVTNFHLPESTLLMLVSAFAGVAPVMAAYAQAIQERYRFFSYGDAMLITRDSQEWH